MFGLFRGKKDNEGREVSGKVGPIPFTRFDGLLRCIRLNDLKADPLAHEAVNLVCSKFFGRDTANTEGIKSDEAIRKRLGIVMPEGAAEAPFAFRRFAGDASLSRGSYYSVAMDNGGYDGGTLECELGRYSDLRELGPVHIRDTTLFGPEDWIYFHRALRDRFPTFPQMAHAMHGSLVFHFDFRLTGIPGSFRFDSKYLMGAPKLSHGEFAVFVPTTTMRHQMERCVDLRLPATRAWLMQRLDIGLPGVTTVNVNGSPAPFGIQRDLPPTPGLGATGATGFCGPHHEWDGTPPNAPKGLPKLLAYLTFPFLGGSPVTDAIARYLRHGGAEALIFPSARSDVEVEIRSGTLKSWRGWNLVDYRTSPPPHDRSMVLCGAESWAWDISGASLAMPPPKHETQGSFRLEGQQASLHKMLQEQARVGD